MRWLSLLMALLCCAASQGAFQYYAPLTIHHGQVTANQSSFTVYFHFSDARLKSAANGGPVQSNSGYDINFYSDLGITKIPWEIKNYDPVNGVIDGFFMWTSLSSTVDGTPYMYYDNPSIATFQGGPSANVYDSHTVAIWHLGNGTTLSGSDSGINAYALTNHSATAALGNMDGAASFNGTNQWMQSAAYAVNATNPGTLEFWFNMSSFPGSGLAEVYYEYAGGVTNISMNAPVTNTSTFSFQYNANSAQLQSTQASWTTGTWYSVAATWNVNDDQDYINGALDNSTGSGSSPPGGDSGTTDFTNIGRYSVNSGSGTGGYFPGLISEVMVSSVVRSSTWLATKYNNQSSPGTFITLGSSTFIGSSTVNVIGSGVGPGVIGISPDDPADKRREPLAA